MKKSTTVKLSIFVAVAIVSSIFSIHGNVFAMSSSLDDLINLISSNMVGSDSDNMQGKHNPDHSTTTRDMVTLLLESKTLAPHDYIEVYDSTPYKIVAGHLVAKVPCDKESRPSVAFLTGVAPNLKKTEAELVPSLSNPGNLCLYHVDLISDAKNTVTDVAILNNGTDTISFPQSSSVGVGVDEIAPLPPGMG